MKYAGLALLVCWSAIAISAETGCGNPLGPAYKGETPKSNGSETYKSCAGRGDYGEQYQCVEYIKRFHAANDGPNRWNPGNVWASNGIREAYKYFDRASELGLEAIANGSNRRPQPDDILVFNKKTCQLDAFGHIAIVASVTDDGIRIVEQNWTSSYSATYAFLPRDKTKSGYYLSPRSCYPVRGWLRAGNKPSTPKLLSPSNGATIAQNVSGIGCAYNSTRGYGIRIEFDWTDSIAAGGIRGYDVFAKHTGAEHPIVDGVVGTSSLTYTSCNGFVIDDNLDGWTWRVRARSYTGEVGDWSQTRTFKFAPCRLPNGSPCFAPPP